MPITGCYPYKPGNDWLASHAANVTSQFGEDGILREIFGRLPGERAQRWCVDFGAWDGRHLSNSWNLIANHGWNAVLIEAAAERFAELQATHAGNDRVTALNRLVHFEGPDLLDDILQGTRVPQDPDLLAIDIDGNDYHVWESLRRYEPKIVLIEINPSFPNELAFVQARDMGVYQGSSLLAMVLLGKAKGYELISTTSHNAFFARRDLYPLFDITDNDIHLMHSPGPYQTWIYQLYDGTVQIAGCQQMLWDEGRPMTLADIRGLPPGDRVEG
ncbi:MAG: FkbM family methyltransferase [Gammaproteobacteria bacterium]|nr:FkbM family methyltransferase [Gammaproteobacteria bacterium]